MDVKNRILLSAGVVAAFSLTVMAGSAFASTLGQNITIPDEWTSAANPWYSPQNEDQEVEPGTLTGQNWDLEGFFFDVPTGPGPAALSMVGGFDFVNGVPGHEAASGDIFVDLDGGAQYGTGIHASLPYAPGQMVSDTFGYDFVMDLNFGDGTNGTYAVYDIRGLQGLQIETVHEQFNDPANPWRYVPGTGDIPIFSGNITYWANVSSSDPMLNGYGLAGIPDSHNVATVDMIWILANGYDPDIGFTTHFTQECGNDNLIGHFAVPEPMTLSLLGLGLFGVVMRKRIWA